MLLAVIPLLEKGMWFMDLNMQDAYFHIDIYPACRKCLRFKVGLLHFQYRVLPVGLTTAPQVFTKVS